MMMPYENPDDFVSETREHVCEFHKRQPWERNYPGCTCSATYGLRKATSEEREQNIKNRLAEQKLREKHMADYDAGLIK